MHRATQASIWGRVGRGFIPGMKSTKIRRALAPEVRFSLRTRPKLHQTAPKPHPKPDVTGLLSMI